MSTEPYPEVSVDESGIVPPQGGRPQEWPKKIRTLTATELDRLTIDSAGRFYWDGKLVNYEPPEDRRERHEPSVEKPDEHEERPAMDLAERTPYDLHEPIPSEPAESTDEHERHEVEPVHAVRHEHDEPQDTHDLDIHPVAHHARHTAAAADVPDALAAQLIRVPDRIRISLSRWQSLGAVIVALGIMIGALGVAAYGFVATHEWGCRTGLIQTYCPAMPGTPSMRRPDIPA